MQTLQIVESAYRATLEEQDDVVLWMTHAMRSAGAPLSVLLRANAVNYAVAAQECSGLQIGAWVQAQAPRLASVVRGLLAKGVRVLAIEEDLVARGIPRSALVEGIEIVPAERLAALLDQFARVWHW